MGVQQLLIKEPVSEKLPIRRGLLSTFGFEAFHLIRLVRGLCLEIIEHLFKSAIFL